MRAARHEMAGTAAAIRSAWEPAVAGTLTDHGYRRHRVLGMLHLLKSGQLSEKSFYLIVAMSAVIVWGTLMAFGRMTIHEWYLVVVGCAVSVPLFGLLQLPFRAFFHNGIWLKAAPPQQLTRQQIARTVAYTRSIGGEITLNVVELARKNRARLPVDAAPAIAQTARAGTGLEQLSAALAALDCAVKVIDDSPARRRHVATAREAPTLAQPYTAQEIYRGRPRIFGWAGILGAFLVGLAGLGTVLSLFSLVTAVAEAAEVASIQRNTYTLVIMVALVAIGGFTLRVRSWENIAWIELSTSKNRHPLYLDAIKEFRDYAVTVFTSFVVIGFFITVAGIVTSLTPRGADEPLTFPAFGSLFISIFILLTLSSVGKVLGSGRTSLEKALLLKSFEER